MTPLSDEDVARMREEHTPATSVVGSHLVCCACLHYWPCDAYRLLEERERFGDLLARIHRDGGHYISTHGWHKAVEDADAQVVKWLGREHELESAPKAEASMTAEDFVRDLEADIHMLTGREAGRSPLITKAFIGAIRERDLSIAAAARREAEERFSRVHIGALENGQLNYALAREQEDRAEKAEHSRQALAEALRAGHRKLGTYAGVFKDDKELTRLLGEWEAALATHGQDHPHTKKEETK